MILPPWFVVVYSVSMLLHPRGKESKFLSPGVRASYRFTSVRIAAPVRAAPTIVQKAAFTSSILHPIIADTS
jgi:hypothetical protein